MASPSTENPARAVFRYPNFRWYMSARFLVTLSSEMQSVAVAWQIYGITHRPLDLGLVGLAQFLPGILLFLAAGHAADRYPRHNILRTSYCGFALTSVLLLSLTLRGVASPMPIYALLMLNGISRAFAAPASQAFLPLLVSREHFANAVAWASSIFQVATVAGPVMGGLLYGVTGSPLPVYAFAAVAYIIAVLLMLGLKITVAERTASSPSLTIVFQGIRFIASNRLILGAISLDLFAVLLGGAVALLPVYAQDVLHAGAMALGFLRSAPGFGAVLMAIVVAHWPLKRHEGRAMLGCVAAFGVFTIVFGLSRNMIISLASLVLLGAADMISVIVRHTLIQLATPDEMRGRVSAVNAVFIGASNEVGQFESGLTAQWFGAVPAVLIGGVATIAIVGLWAWWFPALAKIDRLELTDPEMAQVNG